MLISIRILVSVFLIPTGSGFETVNNNKSRNRLVYFLMFQFWILLGNASISRWNVLGCWRHTASVTKRSPRGRGCGPSFFPGTLSLPRKRLRPGRPGKPVFVDRSVRPLHQNLCQTYWRPPDLTSFTRRYWIARHAFLISYFLFLISYFLFLN